jgi:phosphate-selective porin
MKYKVLKKLVAILSAVLLGSSAASAADPLIDTLVSKGYLTSSEAKEIAAGSTSNTAFAAGGKHTKKITISGRLQGQYDNLTSDRNDAVDPGSTNHFYFRRLFLGANGELESGWGGNIVMDFAGEGSKMEQSYVYWKTDHDATLKFGYAKIPFMMEETDSTAKAKTIERSAMTRFFSDVGKVSAQHTGIFVDGEVGKIMYASSITNSLPAENSKLGGAAETNNDLMWAGRLSSKVADGLLIGANTVYQPRNSVFAKTVSGDAPDVLAWGGFSQYDIDQLQLTAEFATANIKDGKRRIAGKTGDSNVLGYYAQAAYKINPSIEPVVRWSQLDTDGMCFVDAAELIRRAPVTNSNFDKMTSIYTGVNYYLQGDDVKFMLGYEFAKAEETQTNAAAETDISGVRARIQLLF